MHLRHDAKPATSLCCLSLECLKSLSTNGSTEESEDTKASDSVDVLMQKGAFCAGMLFRGDALINIH